MVYNMHFQANVGPNKLTSNCNNFCGRCLLNLKIIYFFINIIISRHLELEIALAIPASFEAGIANAISSFK